MQQRVYEMQTTMSTNSISDWLTIGAVCSKVLLTLLSASEDSVCSLQALCSREGRTLRTSAVGYFDNGMKLSIIAVYAQRAFEVFNKILV